MPNPKPVSPNSCDDFDASNEYPTVHLEPTDCALVLSINPLPDFPGRIIVAHFGDDSSYSGLFGKALDNISGWGNLIEINIISGSENNSEKVETLRRLFSDKRVSNFTWRSSHNDHKCHPEEIKVSIASDISVQFDNNGVFISSVAPEKKTDQKTVPNTSSGSFWKNLLTSPLRRSPSPEKKGLPGTSISPPSPPKHS